MATSSCHCTEFKVLWQVTGLVDRINPIIDFDLEACNYSITEPFHIAETEHTALLLTTAPIHTFAATILIFD